jgi:hypothetical protein
LGGADRNVRTELAGWRQQRERERIRRYDHGRSRCMGALCERAMVFDVTIGRGILKQDSAEILRFEVDRLD